MGISLTLTIETSTIDTSMIANTGNRVVESIYTRSTLQSCAIAKNLGISLTLTIETSTIDTSIANIARDRVVESIDTRSTLQSCAIAKNLGISLGRDSSYKGRHNSQVHHDGAALILR